MIKREKIFFTTFPSPIGEILISRTSKGVNILTFEPNKSYFFSKLENFKPFFDVIEEKKEFEREIKQLDEYFWGKRKKFDIEIDLSSGTPFCRSVWDVLYHIPYGVTLSYEEVAQRIGNKNASRAVGQACKKNPVAIFVPCHRVIGKNKKLTGFSSGLEIKAYLLKIEGLTGFKEA